MKRYLILLVLLLCSTISYSQLIGEGDTLWAKSGLPTIRQVQFSPDGTKLAVLSADAVGKLTMFDSETGKELWTVPKETYYFYQFSYSLDGSKIYTLPPAEKQISIIDVNTGVILDTLPVVTTLDVEDWYYGFVYQTKDPNILLLGDRSMCFAVYDISKRQIIKELFGNRNNKLYASPNSDYFINAYQYELENKWRTKIVMMDINTLDVNTAVILGEENALVETGGDIKISYNGKYAATNFGGRALQIWDLENKKLFKEYLPSIDRGGPQSTLAFSHDNELIINSGGYYKDDLKPTSTNITNLVNDKRAIIFENTPFGSIDINMGDTKFAASRAGTVFVFRLNKDAVPVKETPTEIDSIIYPNPTTGNIIVNIPERIGLINKGQLFDNTGKIIKNYLPHELQTSDSKLILNINDLNNGLYILKLSNSNNVLTYKIILEK